jgi:hypothetical protein
MRSKQPQRKSKTILRGVAIAVVLHFGLLAASAQTTEYGYSGSETTITLNPGTYIITAYGARGGGVVNARFGGVGAEMSAEFNFSTPTTLTLLVGGFGGTNALDSSYGGAGGGGGSFVVQGSTPLVVAGGGGGGANSLIGGDGTITTSGTAGGGNAGGSGGIGGGGGSGGDPSLTGSFGSNTGEGAAGGGGFYTDGTGGRSVIDYAIIEGEGADGVGAAGGGGSSFEDGGAGGISNLGISGNALELLRASKNSLLNYEVFWNRSSHNPRS